MIMSGGSWLCENESCGIIFLWSQATKWADYGFGSENKSVSLPGDKKPAQCPECGGGEIDSLEG